MSLFGRTTMRDVHVSDWSQAPRATKMLAAAAMVLVLGGVWMVYLASSLIDWQGPVSIASNEDHSILVASYQRLFLVDSSNHLTQLRASDLGIVGPINSVNVDQRQWLLGDDDTGQFFTCAPDLKRCHPRFPVHGKSRMFTRAHGVAFVDGQMIVTDSDHHRLRVYDTTGREVLVTRTEPVPLCYPNDVIAANGYLYVADTNNLRIARINPSDNYRSETFIQTSAGSPFRQANCADISSRVADHGDAYVNMLLDTSVTVGRPALPPARPHHIFPTTLIHSRLNQWWVIQTNGRLEHGDVVLYSSDGAPVKRVALPADADPASMLEIDDHVLITDPTLAKIFDVSLDGDVKAEWGPTSLKAEFAQILKTRDRLQSFKPVGWLVIGLGIIVAAIVIIRELLRVKGEWNPSMPKLRPAIVTPASLSAPEVWLSVQPKFVRQFKLAAWLILAAMLVMLPVEAWILYHTSAVQSSTGHARKISIVMACIMTAVILLVSLTSALLVYQRARERIGTNGRQLLIQRGNGKVFAQDFTDVMASGAMLLAGRRFITLFSKRGEMIYPREQFEALIVARIPARNFVSAWQLSLVALRRGSLVTWSMVILIAVVILSELFVKH